MDRLYPTFEDARTAARVLAQQHPGKWIVIYAVRVAGIRQGYDLQVHERQDQAQMVERLPQWSYQHADDSPEAAH